VVASGHNARRECDSALHVVRVCFQSLLHLPTHTMTTTCFHLSITLPNTSMTARLSVPPAELYLDLGLIQGNTPTTLERSLHTECPSDDPPETAETPATSTRRGSFNYDRECGNYPLEWSDLAAFNAWRQEEELCYSIELIASRVGSGGSLWTQNQLYICSRQLSGGQKEYKKKNPDWKRKIGSKKTGCHCRVIIKLYLHTNTILGNYRNVHDHEVSSDNIAYTWMSGIAWEQIKSMLVQKVDHKEIVCN